MNQNYLNIKVYVISGLANVKQARRGKKLSEKVSASHEGDPGSYFMSAITF